MSRYRKDSEDGTALISQNAAGPAQRVARTGELEPGTHIGTYVVQHRLATGGFGALYDCLSDLGERVALKILHISRVTPEIVERFHREVHVMERLEHPNIVKLFDVGVYEDGRPFMTMELLEGESLRDRVRKTGRVPPEQALAWLDPLVSALSVAHSNGFVHRDLKPSNVFLAKTPEGGERVVLLDFGIAKMYEEDDAVSLTTSRHMVGTPSAMAPEQVGRGVVDPRTDIYALGVLAFRLVTGRNPFYDESKMFTRHLHLGAKAPRASEIAPISPQIDDVLAKAMSKEKDDRHPTVEVFLEDLRKAVESGSMLAATRSEAVEEDGSAALAVYIGVLSEGEIEDAGDEVLDDRETILELSRDHLLEGGCDVVMESGNSLLVVRRVDDEAEDLSDFAQRVWGLVAALESREGRHDGVSYNVCVDACEPEEGSGQSTDATSLTEWLPDTPVNGVIGTEETAVVLGADVEPIPGSDGLFRLRGSG